MASALCYILKFLKLSGLNQIFYIRDQQIIKPGPLSSFINNFYWNTVMHIFYVLSMPAFETFLDSIETFFYNRDRPSKPEIFTTWSFWGKFVDSCSI